MLNRVRLAAHHKHMEVNSKEVPLWIVFAVHNRDQPSGQLRDSRPVQLGSKLLKEPLGLYLEEAAARSGLGGRH
jgi:hypothetical protein